MPALLELASHHNRQLLFSATVGAGTPFLSFASKSLLGLEIREIHGILNGTTNHILTSMEEDSLSFEKALRDAQQKGYAEKDPRNDIDGYDTAAKIVIIANWILKNNIGLHDVEITGISGVKRKQLKEAAASGKKIKLIGRLTKSKATVKPELVPIKDPVCVPGTLNALTFSTKHAGDVTLIGTGAGGEQTASAILRDLIDIRRNYQA
jgi:homoserine dehydrogenase